MVEVLLQQIANAKAKDINGRDVVMIAEQNKLGGVLKILRAKIQPKDNDLEVKK